MSTDLRAIVLAAGKGTRMNSDKPKVCFKLAGKTLIRRVLSTVLKLDIEFIGIVVGYEKQMVIEAANETPFAANIWGHTFLHYFEQENQNGTGHAVLCAKEGFDYFKGNVFVLCGDVPLLKPETLKKMLEKHEETKASCTVLTMIPQNPESYGRMVRDDNNRIKEIVEFKDASDEIKNINEINTGIYCFNNVDLFKALEKVDNNNAQKEYYLTDVIKIMYNDGKTVESVVLEDPIEAAGVNSPDQLAELEKECAKFDKEHDWWY